MSASCQTVIENGDFFDLSLQVGGNVYLRQHTGLIVMTREGAANLVRELSAALSKDEQTGDVCPDDHCNRRSPCEGRAAMHCRYYDRIQP